MEKIEVSVIVESYTHNEGSGRGRLTLSLEAAIAMANKHGRAEVLLTDVSDDLELSDFLKSQFPNVQRVDAAGLSYDDAKARAAARAMGLYVLYLDGDCVPDPGWMEAHLALLKSGEADASGGFTRYDIGFLAAVNTVMDFGFLLPKGKRILSCYASNNCGFKRELLIAAPVPESLMRCNCYAHAQLLLRRGTPIKMAPEASVQHEVQPFFIERYRQGFDAVAAAWVNPRLPEARLMRLGPIIAPILYARNVAFDWKRVCVGRRDLQLSSPQMLLAIPLFAVFRLVDLAGMLKALTLPRRQRRSTLAK